MQVQHKAGIEMSHPLAVRRLQEYGIFPEDEIDEVLEKYKLRDITAEQAGDMGFHNPAEGIYITYTDDKDSRIRYHRTGFQAQQDLGKYGQRPHTPPALYFVPGVKPGALQDKEIPFLIVEGEFKAIVADYIANEGLSKPAIIPIAIGGVWSWRSAKSGVEMLPAFDCIGSGNTVYIAFDMDNPVNPQVQKALQRLVDKLLQRTNLVRVRA